MQCSDVTTIVWGNTPDTANYHLRHAFWSDLCHVWQKFLALPFSLLEFKLNDRGVPFAFQITVCWKSLTCRQFFLRGIRLISMKSKEHTIPSKFALLWVFCILETALPLQMSFLSLNGSLVAELCCFLIQLGHWLQSQRCPTARNGSDENQTPRGADRTAQETWRGQWLNYTIACNISAPDQRQRSPHKFEFFWSNKRGTWWCWSSRDRKQHFILFCGCETQGLCAVAQKWIVQETDARFLE